MPSLRTLRAMTDTGLPRVAGLVIAVGIFGAGIGCGETGGGAAGTGGAGGSGGAAGSEAPIITKVQWDWAIPCNVDTTTALDVTVFATDDDTEAGALVYSGSVSDCTPDIDADVSILTCTPGLEEKRSGTVTVTDPEGNSDTVNFGFFACESDEVCQGGDPCE